MMLTARWTDAIYTRIVFISLWLKWLWYIGYGNVGSERFNVIIWEKLHWRQCFGTRKYSRVSLSIGLNPEKTIIRFRRNSICVQLYSVAYALGSRDLLYPLIRTRRKKLFRIQHDSIQLKYIQMKTRSI